MLSSIQVQSQARLQFDVLAYLLLACPTVVSMKTLWIAPDHARHLYMLILGMQEQGATAYVADPHLLYRKFPQVLLGVVVSGASIISR